VSGGSTIRCRLEDAGDLLSVFVDQDYDRVQIPWPELHSIVDVGSTVGSFTVWAARRSPQARLISVEPNPAVYPYLVGNVRENQLSERVTTVEAALGAVDGVAAIEDDRGYSTLVRIVPIGSGKGPRVRLLTLEQLFDETRMDHCDLLKLDCEGGEYDILLSASDRLLRRIRAIVCEYHRANQGQPAQLIERLAESGFRVEADQTPVGFFLATRTE
jgi:FkbM family methyltransferase